MNINPLKLYDMGILIVLFSLLGARVLHVFADGQLTDYVNLCVSPKKVKVPKGPGGPHVDHCVSTEECGNGFLCDTKTNSCYPPRDCLSLVKVWKGGLVFYGGFIFAAAFAFWYMRRFKLPGWKISDIMGYTLPFGLAITRSFGCMLNGCCYGKPTSIWMGVRYARGLGPYDDHIKSGLIVKGSEHSVHVHPTQIYHGLAALAIFLVAYLWVNKRKRFDGQVFAFFLVTYSIQRFIVEFFRSDPRGSLLLLSTSQLISLATIAVGIWIYIKKPSRNKYLENSEI
jgi:phosphatidylglycerol---prolipoprotein diacylglyceryl transferase